MNRNQKTIIVVVVAIVCVSTFIVVLRPFKKEAVNLDDFAKCLAQKNVTMYGAYWCPHCQNQKAEFGDSFKYASYVECTQDTQRCIDAGIEGYPTWVLGDGTKLVGEQSLQQLAEASGCIFPPAAQ